MLLYDRDIDYSASSRQLRQAAQFGMVQWQSYAAEKKRKCMDSGPSSRS
jgi:hypothetical protein